MSYTIISRRYAYDNITAGNAAGQEQNQNQFFPYQPGTSGGVNGDPVYGFERAPTGGSSYARYILNAEIAGNGIAAAFGYGLEIP